MAILGYNTIGGSSTAGFTFSGYGCKFTPSENGTIQSITAYIVSTGSANFIPVIYSDVAGVPTTLLATGSQGNFDTTPAWQTAPITYFMTSGVPIWLGLIVNDGLRINYDAGSANQSYESSGVSYPTPNNPEAVFDDFNEQMSIYATYSPQKFNLFIRKFSRPALFKPGNSR
jgi:hypothetical protein